MKRLSKEVFVNKAKDTHKDKYDYSKVEYVNNYTKVCIICPIHGEFWQKPHNHLNGKGCRECAYAQTSKRCRYSTKDFIRKAKEIHGDKYDYSKVEYTRNIDKVRIKCSIHGEFWQTPNDHIDGCGCPECGKECRQKHSMSNSRIYKTYYGMIQRCFNPKSSKYSCYGGRGISVCKEWQNFQNFYDWAIANGYKESLTIERIDVNGDYEPSNCKWIPIRQQFYNQRKTKFVNIYGCKMSIAELRDKLGIKRGILEYYLSRYGNEKAVSYLENKFANELILAGLENETDGN